MKAGKKLGIALIAFSLGAAGLTQASLAGWNQKNGKYYYIDEKTNTRISDFNNKSIILILQHLNQRVLFI